MKKKNRSSFDTINEIFNPASIAVVGASPEIGSIGYHYLQYLLGPGYVGKIYAVNPRYPKILDLPAYSCLEDIPGNVEYVISCISAGGVIDLIKQSGVKKVKAVHLFTARFSETGDPAAKKLELEILEEARKQKVRLIGPNCMGIYNPKAGIHFNYDLPTIAGNIGGIIQSGGLAGDFVRFGALRGVSFSKVVSFGNGLDLNECDFLDYLADDPDTRVIFLYLEGVQDGPRFIRLLKQIASNKPIIILKGGRTIAGCKAAASHTASIAGAADIFSQALKQHNVIIAKDLTEMIDLAVGFSMQAPVKNKNITMVGGGGGKCVLSSDEAEEAGLCVPALPIQVVAKIAEKEPEMAQWIGNPVDFSIMYGRKISPPLMLDFLANSPEIDLLFCNITDDNPFGGDFWLKWIQNEIDQYLRIAATGKQQIIVIICNPQLTQSAMNNWRWITLAKQRERLIKAGIPVFSSIKRAARAIYKIADYYEKKK